MSHAPRKIIYIFNLYAFIVIGPKNAFVRSFIARIEPDLIWATPWQLREAVESPSVRGVGSWQEVPGIFIKT